MSLFALLAAGAAATPARLDPVKLFLDADIVVQIVLAGLGVASVAVWTIIISFAWRLARLSRRADAYEAEFWKARNVEAFQAERATGKAADLPPARVVAAGLAEWRRSFTGKPIDREGTRQRLAGAMDSTVAEQADNLANRLNFLATVAAAAPFIGLFGTVWGIMTSFFQIGSQQNSSLAVVAPGISEALFATAIGLFAAIPALIAYNRFAHRVNRFESRLQRFADRFHATLSRELDAN